jgi:hypothetical protein
MGLQTISFYAHKKLVLPSSEGYVVYVSRSILRFSASEWPIDDIVVKKEVV